MRENSMALGDVAEQLWSVGRRLMHDVQRQMRLRHQVLKNLFFLEPDSVDGQLVSSDWVLVCIPSNSVFKSAWAAATFISPVVKSWGDDGKVVVAEEGEDVVLIPRQSALALWPTMKTFS